MLVSVSYSPAWTVVLGGHPANKYQQHNFVYECLCTFLLLVYFI